MIAILIDRSRQYLFPDSRNVIVTQNTNNIIMEPIKNAKKGPAYIKDFYNTQLYARYEYHYEETSVTRHRMCELCTKE